MTDVAGTTSRSGRWVPAALLALALVPVLIGSIRVAQLVGGPEGIEPDARFDTAPAAVVVHIVASIAYAVLGAFQFSARTRRRHPAWHRRTGRVLVPLGLVVAGSALWLTLLYDRKEGTGDVLHSVRLLVGVGMAACIVLGFAAIRRRDIAAHRAWMIRAYALALGAGTQAFTVGFGELVVGSCVVRTDLLMSAGWGLNLAVGELVVRRSRGARVPRQRAAAAGVWAVMPGAGVAGARGQRPVGGAVAERRGEPGAGREAQRDCGPAPSRSRGPGF